jgi:N-methylhydantoinase B
VESLLEASSQITPHKKVGDGCSSRSIIIGGRSNKTGKGYVQYEIFGGGSGGRSGKDGVSGTNVNQSNAKIAPIEIIESEFATPGAPLRVDPRFRRSGPVPRRVGICPRVRGPRQRRAFFLALDQTHSRSEGYRRRHEWQDRPLYV